MSERTVITFGTFDVFHVGHIRVLQRAAELGDRLVVGVSAPVGAILGIVSLRRIKRTGAGGKGFAIAAIAVGGAITVLGWLFPG